MAHHLFKRRTGAEADTSAFAATELSLPPCGPLSAHSRHRTPGADLLPSKLSDGGATDAALPAPEPSLDRRPTLSHIGRYALKGLIGSGGLGQVHEAWDPLLSRAVAVKTLHVEADAAVRAALDSLFIAEARTAAGLSHRHIVTVHDAGLSPHGVYIAMERLRGQDLRQRLAQGWQPTPLQAAQLVRRVADALAYAHARGVVHCDIKPANIFLCRRDKPKVLDFGIARIAHRSALTSPSSPAPPATEGATTVAGSPHYLAPEQLLCGPLDARTDVHALGAVLYELLTLRKAFSGGTVQEMADAVLGERPPPAHRRRPGVPRTLSAIAGRSLAREPADRYATAACLSGDLRAWIERHADDPPPTAVAASEPTAADRPRRPQAQRRGGAVLAWALATAALGVGAALGAAWIF